MKSPEARGNRLAFPRGRAAYTIFFLYYFFMSFNYLPREEFISLGGLFYVGDKLENIRTRNYIIMYVVIYNETSRVCNAK